MSEPGEPPSTQMSVQDSSLELRVLTGAQRDAHCPVHAGATVGNDLSCDIVLEDADEARYFIHLQPGTGEWSVGTLIESSRETPRQPFNEPILLGKVAITIAPQATPWPERLSPGTTTARASVDDQPLVMSEDVVIPPPDGNAGNPSHPVSDERRPGPHIPPRPVVPPLCRRDTWPLMLGAGAILLAMLVALIMAYLPDATGTSRHTADPRQQAAQQSISQINAALARLGVAARLHVSMAPGGTVTVSGWVRDEQEERQIATALSQIWPMPALRLSIEAKALRRAQDTLKGFAIKYAPRYEGNGRLRVSGISPDTQTRTAALQALAEQVPGMTILGGDIVLRSEVEQALLARMKAADLPVASLTWRADGLEVDTSAVDASDQPRLQAIQEDLDARYLNIFIWTKPQAGAPKPENNVPFRIRSVVGGPQPFVVLGDGAKLMTGGTYQGYRLVEISEKRLVFEGPHRAIVPR